MQAPAVQLVKMDRYNHLALKHGKDTRPMQIVWSCGRQLQEPKEHQPLHRLGGPQSLAAIEEAAVVKYMNTIL